MSVYLWKCLRGSQIIPAPSTQSWQFSKNTIVTRQLHGVASHHGIAITKRDAGTKTTRTVTKTNLLKFSVIVDCHILRLRLFLVHVVRKPVSHHCEFRLSPFLGCVAMLAAILVFGFVSSGFVWVQVDCVSFRVNSSLWVNLSSCSWVCFSCFFYSGHTSSFNWFE